MHWMWNDGSTWWSWAVMAIGMVAFWTVVGWVFVSVVRNPGRLDGEPRRSPEQILAERFACGEIDTGEYEGRLAALRSARNSTG